MLEVTIVSTNVDTGQDTLKAFQFENDALQAFLTECSANETGCRLTSLRALGVPLTVTGDLPKPAAKAKVNEPITRTAGPGSVRSAVPTEQPTIKPKTEKP
jgi:hypothetical protein